MEDKNEFVGKIIKPIPKQEENIGVDTNNQFASDLLQGALNETLDISALENFTNVANSRESIYQLIDDMCKDTTIKAIIESYAEDATERNEDGKIVWVQSNNENARKYVEYLLDVINVDKHIFGWVLSLIKYGDLYLRLFRESDYDNDNIFDTKEADKLQTLNEAKAGNSNILKEKETLQESVSLDMPEKQDHFANYVEAVRNPGEMFELTKHGKTMGYIQAPYPMLKKFKDNGSGAGTTITSLWDYNINKEDVTVYPATEYVHALLEDDSARAPETVTIFKNDESLKNGNSEGTYDVRTGKSLLYDWFKAWRLLSLLEDSVVLGRTTKSSIIRLVQVEVGDMDKSMIAPHLQGIKQLFEQKTSINTGYGMGEYTNPGPVDNTGYIPVHEGKGAINISQTGGDYDPKQLTDLEYFRDRFFSGTGIPKQYLGFTDDSTGFNGGTSLSLTSSKYGKRTKRIQQATISALTDLINIILLDRGLTAYINDFTICMVAPLTQEELDRRESQATNLGVIRDTMDILQDIEDVPTRLKILKSLFQSFTNNTDVAEYIEDEINRLKNSEEPAKDNNKNNNRNNNRNSLPSMGGGETNEEEPTTPLDNPLADNTEETEETTAEETSVEEEPAEEDTDYLPSFDELGIEG